MKYDFELSEIIEKELIHTLFQPIVNLKNGEVLGYEALSRGPEESSLYSPIHLLEAAKEEDKLWELETIFRKSAINKASCLKLKELLFLNVEPNIIHDKEFQEGFTKSYLIKHHLNPEQIVFEITERSAMSNYSDFENTIRHYKNQGYKIAIDDTGAGYSNFSALSKVKPYYIKIDMGIVRDIDKEPFNQAIISSFVILSKLTNTKLIAEGIETKGELETLIQLGVHAAQGYFISTPSKQLKSISSEIKNLIMVKNKPHASYFYHTEKYIGEISNVIAPFESSHSCLDIKDFLEKNNVEGTCILNKNEVVGLIMKNHLDATLSGQYGYSLYARKPVSKIMDPNCLTVDYFTPINIVAELAMSRHPSKIYDNIIITKGLKYWGIVSVIELLRQFLEMERNKALELNPLTGLPGNTLINKALSYAIDRNMPNVVLYIDLDNFKAYNDVYGFEKGDRVIQMTKDTIMTCIKSYYQFTHFIGHIGGDDFIAIIECDFEDGKKICQQIINYYSEKIKDHFNIADQKKGYIVARDRNKALKQFNLTTISIAGIYGPLNFFSSPDKLAQYMSTVKKKVKEVEKSSYILEAAPKNNIYSFNLS